MIYFSNTIHLNEQYIRFSVTSLFEKLVGATATIKDLERQVSEYKFIERNVENLR